MRFLIRECQREACGFRFPMTDGEAPEMVCPRCGAATAVVVGPYAGHATLPRPGAGGRQQLEVVLDNIRSVYNVGSMFRTADGAGVSHLHLCGITPTPDHHRLVKTALGAQEAVAWSYHPNALRLAERLRAEGRPLWALEGGDQSESLFDLRIGQRAAPAVLVVGNEKSGVDPELLDRCDRVLTVPMTGVKSSLNVAVAFGIAVYWLRYGVERIEGE